MGQLSIELSNSKQGGELGEDRVLYADPNLQTQALKILETTCLACHGPDSTNGVTNITNVYFLVDSQLITPGDASVGRLIGAMEDGSMPQGLPAVPPQKISTLKSWIASMRWGPPQ